MWNFETSGSFAWNATYDERLDSIVRLTKMTRQAEALDGLEPAGTTYQNEANPFMTGDWRRAYWGDNYARLLEVKEKYDPDRLLNCWRCVGFEEGDMEGARFGCMGRAQGVVDRAIQ